jgi:hypothetical protein
LTKKTKYDSWNEHTQINRRDDEEKLKLMQGQTEQATAHHRQKESSWSDATPLSSQMMKL